jgi:hypothetical protein
MLPKWALHNIYRWCGHRVSRRVIVMSDIYTSEINGIVRPQPAAGEDRLSPRAAIYVALGLSLLGWTPLLLPVLMFFHR